MLRTASRPRWLALLALAVVLAGIAVQLGRWQWDVAHDVAREEAVREVQQRPVEPLGEVVAPHATFPDDGSGQRVSTTGTYDPQGQLLVVGRLLDGREGAWVLTRFTVEETGANLPVVRGWVPEGAAAPAPPQGQVELVGSLAPGEAPATDEGEGRWSSIDLARLVNDWPGDLYNAFAFVVSEDGATPVGVDLVPPPLPDTSFVWRNAMYAVQWWLFGAFALWMWWRMVRQAAEDERPEDERPEGPDPETPEPETPDPETDETPEHEELQAT